MVIMHLLAFAVLCAGAWAGDVFVMLALDTVTNSGELKDPIDLKSQLEQLKSSRIDGIMIDVWWGITEPSPKVYEFDAYKNLLACARTSG